MVERRHHALVLASLLWLLAMPVVAQDQLPPDPTQPFIEVELKPKSVYVQSMVHYTIRLYRNSHLQRGYFLDQEIADTVTEFSHDTPARYVTRAGREYELLERHYLLFPQRSGTITLPAAIFSSNNLFIQGAAPTLTVRPRPDSGDNSWLPAMELQLHQTIDQPEGGIHSGMQLRRTILIQARGLTSAQLPTIAAPQLEGMEIQDLGSELEQEIVAGVVVGQRRIRQLLIPKRGGDFTLPRVQIQWWNSTVNTPQTATLPVTTLTVMDSPVPQTQSVAPPPAKTGEENRIERESIPGSSNSLTLPALLFSLVVYGLLIWHYRVFARLQHRLHIIACRHRFKRACMANNPAAANTALLSWGDLVMGEEAVLSVLGFRKLFTDSAACAALLELDRTMYSTPKPDWSGRIMLERILPLMKNHKQPQPDPGWESLPPLYG